MDFFSKCFFVFFLPFFFKRLQSQFKQLRPFFLNAPEIMLHLSIYTNSKTELLSTYVEYKYYVLLYALQMSFWMGFQKLLHWVHLRLCVEDVICTSFSGNNNCHYWVAVKQTTSLALNLKYIDYGNNLVLSSCKTFRHPKKQHSVSVKTIHCPWNIINGAASTPASRGFWMPFFSLLKCGYV